MSGKDIFSCAAAIVLTLAFQPVEVSAEKPASDRVVSMEGPYRRQWQKPDQVVDALSIRPGDSVADIGAGSGYFIKLLSERAGAAGVVYAVEVDQRLVEYLNERTRQEGLRNVRTVHARADDPLLPLSSSDLVFFCNTYTFIPNGEDYLRMLRSRLKTGGRVAIIDFHPGRTGPGPALEQRKAREKVIDEALRAGYRVMQEHQFLDYQYFIVLAADNGRKQ